MGTNWSHYEDIPANEDFEYGLSRSVQEHLDTNGEFRMSIITFEPGEGGPLHYHEAPKEEIYFVVEGKIDIRVGDEVIEADAGTFLYAPPETEQQPMNNYDEPAVLLAVNAPGDETDSVRLDDEWNPP